MNDLFKKFKDLLSSSRESKFLVTDDVKLDISKDNFQLISKEISKNKVIFVDGGNGLVARSSDFSLHFVRIADVQYKNNERLSSFVRECFIMANSIIENNKLFFLVSCIDVKDGSIFASYKIDARDSSLTTGKKPIEPCIAVLHVRKLLELEHIFKITESLRETDIIIRDGDFEEGPFVEELISKIKEQKPFVLGVSKTSTILTDSGEAAVEVLLKLGPDSSWVYNNSSPCFVKFHAVSDYVFKVEFINDFNINSLNCIASLCSDPVFLGYPYGLVAVDALARVNSSWVDVYRSLFESVVGVSLMSRDAHDILNKIA